MDSGQTLSARALNRTLLARQSLLARSELELPAALRALCGIQAQYAPSMYIGLWSRLAAFARDELDRALLAGDVVVGTLMRVTIHLVAPEDYWPFAVAVRAARRPVWLRTWGKHVGGADGMLRAVELARARLEEGPLRRAELEALVGKPRAAGLGLWIDLVRVPPAGTWARRRADVFGLASQWVGPPPAGLSEAAAIEHLVGAYLRAFGPASKADVQAFTGLGQRALAPALGTLGARRFATRDGTELFDVADGVLADAEAPAPARFLPTFDPNLLAHARRAEILPEEHRPRLFSIHKPHPDPAFLVDGQVAGTWRFADGRITLDPFTRLDAPARRELEAEAERLATFHA